MYVLLCAWAPFDGGQNHFYNSKVKSAFQDQKGKINIDAMGLEHEFVDGAIKIAHQPTYKLCEAPGTYSVDAEELERLCLLELPRAHREYYLQVISDLHEGKEISEQQLAFYEQMQPVLDELRKRVWERGSYQRALVKARAMAGAGHVGHAHHPAKNIPPEFKKITDRPTRAKMMVDQMEEQELQKIYTPR